MSKLPRTNVIDRQVAAAIAEAKDVAAVTGEDLDTVQGGIGPFPGPLPMYGAPRPLVPPPKPGGLFSDWFKKLQDQLAGAFGPKK